MKKLLILIFILCSILTKGQTKNVLFIGNSYTAYTHLPELTAELAASAGDNMTVGSSAISGYSLLEHSTNATTLALVHQGGWDYVVLQDFSTNPSQPLPWVQQYVYPYAQFFDNEINTHNPGAETVFYMTWGRKDGDAGGCPDNPPVCTYVGMDNLIRERYMYMAQVNHGIVSPVGAVRRYIRIHYPSIELYIDDGSHPTVAGTYAAACTFYATIFRKDPNLITDDYGLPSADAQNIRNAAKRVVIDSLLTWHIGEYDADKQAPTVPNGLSSNNLTQTSLDLTWNPSTDNVGVTDYDVYLNGTPAITISTPAATLSGLTPGTSYSVTVKARDAAGNTSSASSPLSVTTLNPITLTISGVTASNKSYDGTSTATLNTGSASLVGVSGGDDVYLIASGTTGTFSNKNAGTAKTVTTAGFTLGGVTAPKYILIQPTTKADISTAILTISGISANNKVYDGTTAATLNTVAASLVGGFGEDIVNLISSAAVGTFASSNPGTAIAVTTSGFILGGTDSGNYTLSQPTTTANITGMVLTVNGVSANNKVYDGTVTATLNTGGASLSGVLGGDAVNLVTTGAVGAFSNKNSGNNKTVIISGVTLSGPDAYKYIVTQPGATANISKAILTISGVSANNKVYDGTTTATLNIASATLVGVFGADVVTLNPAGASATFASANIGIGIVISTSGFATSGTDAGNYNLTQPTLTANITAYGLSITGVTANNKVYDGTSLAILNTGSAVLVGVIGGDEVTLITTGATGVFSNKNAGTAKTVTTSGFTLGGADANKYAVTQPTALANIAKSNLTVTGIIANSKVYNATTVASLNTGSCALASVLGSDAVSLVTTSVTGSFANKNVAAGKVVTISGLALSGSDAGNYNLMQPSAIANITAAVLTVTGVTANNKIYDRTTVATLNTGSASLSGVLGSDVVNLISSGSSGSFVSANAGSTIVVSISGFTLGGTDSGNYLLTQPTASANITRILLNVVGISANNKVYNANTNAILNTGSATITGVLAGDNVTLNSSAATGNFLNKNVGNGKPVSTSGFTLGGSEALNYTITQPSATANITAAVLTISGVTVNNRVYNHTTNLTLNTGSASLSGVYSGDVVALVSTGATGSFADKNVGTGKIVTISGFSLIGTDSGNYTLLQPSSTADITAANLTISGVTANNKVYDATTAATLNIASASLTGVFGTDVVTLISTDATGMFSNKNAGIARPVITSGFTLGGTDAGNYSLIQPTTNANITGIVLTITGVTVNNKSYNATASATIISTGAALVGVLSGDNVTLASAGATATFSNKNVGNNKTVTAAGFSLGGSDASNYTLIQPTFTADISASGLTISGISANNKVYNTTTTASLSTGSATLVGIYAGDAVSLVTNHAIGNFADKNVGINKSVTTSGFTLGGTDSGNYTLIQPLLNASISAAGLTISGVTATNKVYDGFEIATLNTENASLIGVLGTDVVSIITNGATASFINKNVGNGKTVASTGFSLGGTDAGNYSLTQPSMIANITPKELTIGGSFTANNKIYDGTNSATLTSNNLTLITKIGFDDVNLNPVAVFPGISVGSGQIVSLTGSTLTGVDMLNYTLSLIGAPTATATITLHGLTVRGITASNKIYDGTIAASLNTDNAVLQGVLGSDNVSLITTGAAGSFVNKNKGIAKLVEINGLSLSGTDAGKYTLIEPTASATISAANLTISGLSPINKVYDGTTIANLNLTSASLSGILGTDVVTLVSTAATGTFADKNAGTDKPITTSGFALGATDAGNYILTMPETTGNITPARLNVIGVVANNKSYDGNTSITLNTGNASLVGIFGNEIVTLNSTGVKGNFIDKYAGTGKTVIISGFTIGGSAAGNYALIQPTSTGNIFRRALVVTAKSVSKTYGTRLSFSGTDVSTIGLIPGDTIPIGTITSPGVAASAPVGTYVISVGGGINKNYEITYISGTITVTKSVITAKADDLKRTYGSENHNLSISYSGFKNGDNELVIDVLPVASTDALKTSNVGMYPITIKGGSDNNYDLTLINGTLEIQKAPLIITADDKTKTYGEENPALSVSYSGFVLEQSPGGLDELPFVETEASTSSDAGNYDIIVSGGKSSNYSFIYKNGVLTVKKSDQYITFNDLPDGLRMTQEVMLDAHASSGLDITFEVSDPALEIRNGNLLKINKDGKHIITAKQEGNINWNPASDISKFIVTLPAFDNISSLFTPNNDGINDYWYFPDLDSYGIIKVTVYNRFGKVVYHSDGYKNDWDGTWNGYPLPEASYYYIINSSKKGFITGVVNIVR